jgi:hypothetical protein
MLHTSFGAHSDPQAVLTVLLVSEQCECYCEQGNHHQQTRTYLRKKTTSTANSICISKLLISLLLELGTGVVEGCHQCAA